MKKIIAIAFGILLTAAIGAFSQSETPTDGAVMEMGEPQSAHDHKQSEHQHSAPGAVDPSGLEMMMGHDAAAHQAQAEALLKRVGVDEKTGDFADLSATFVDERGRGTTLGEFVSKPTVLALIFYHCPQSCSMIMSGMALAFNKMALTPGVDYQAMVVSFDDEETPKIALKSKPNYMKLIEKEFPDDQWKFFTGDAENIKALTESTGFRYTKTGKHSFTHPNLIMALAPDGKIIRYIYGTQYNPFDLGMALSEAAKGTPGISIKKMLTYCFEYDSKGRTYVFKTFRIFGGLIVLFLVGFFFFVLRTKKS